MKKTLFAFIGLTTLFLTSCGDSHLNEATALTGCEKNFFVGTDDEGLNNYFISFRVDTVIDDITPFNPDAAMIEGNKTIKICFSHDKMDSDNDKELEFMNTFIYDTKTKKEYSPSLRDNESEFNPIKNCFITVDVPKDTKIADLAIGVNFGGEKDYKEFLPLKKGKAVSKADEVVKVNKEQSYESVLMGNGKVNVVLKSITYNVSDKDKEAKAIHFIKPMAKVAKVEIEYTLAEGDEADYNDLSYLFTEYRAQFRQAASSDPGFSIKGNGTKITQTNYFLLYADEKIAAITDSNSSPSLSFEFNTK